MISLWSSSRERSQRIKHSFNIVVLSFIFFLFLSLANISSFSKISEGSLTGVFIVLDKENIITKFLEWTGTIIIIIPAIYLIYKSAGEILSIIVPPSEFSKGKKYQIAFTVIALCPLCFTFANQFILENEDKKENKFNISNATHYLCFQLYFLIANIVTSKFLNKFLFSSFQAFNSPTFAATKVIAKLLRWHFLGWSSFFLLSFFLPFWILILTVLIVFLNSSFAFLVGRKFGKHSFSRFNISKTFEGFFGSVLIVSVLIAFFLAYIWKSKVFGRGIINITSHWIFLIYAIIGVFFISVVSHLGENTFGISKRILCIKNFGRLFGRKVGGFWDRFDGMSITLFFVGIISWIIYVSVLGTVGINFVSTKKLN